MINENILGGWDFTGYDIPLQALRDAQNFFRTSLSVKRVFTPHMAATPEKISFEWEEDDEILVSIDFFGDGTYVLDGKTILPYQSPLPKESMDRILIHKAS